MTENAKLISIKLLHTAVWLFFNGVIFYMLYAALTNRLDMRLWLGYGLIFAEGVILLIFNSACPLTVWARRYTTSTESNFDIYLPQWLARNNKLIYGSIVFVTAAITVYQLIFGANQPVQ